VTPEVYENNFVIPGNSVYSIVVLVGGGLFKQF